MSWRGIREGDQGRLHRRYYEARSHRGHVYVRTAEQQAAFPIASSSDEMLATLLRQEIAPSHVVPEARRGQGFHGNGGGDEVDGGMAVHHALRRGLRDVPPVEFSATARK